MDSPTSIILNVQTPAYKKVTVILSDGHSHTCDLSFFEKVYCFPKNPDQWKKVSIDKDGLALIWSTRFEAHVDQIIGLALSDERRIRPQEKTVENPSFL